MICGYLDTYLSTHTAITGSMKPSSHVHANNNNNNSAVGTRAGASRGGAFSLSDAAWAEALLCDVLRHARFDTSSPSSSSLDASHNHDHGQSQSQSADASNHHNHNNHNHNHNSNSKNATKNSNNQARGGAVALLSAEDRQRRHIECVTLLASEMSLLAKRHRIPLGAPLHAGDPPTICHPLPYVTLFITRFVLSFLH